MCEPICCQARGSTDKCGLHPHQLELKLVECQIRSQEFPFLHSSSLCGSGSLCQRGHVWHPAPALLHPLLKNLPSWSSRKQLDFAMIPFRRESHPLLLLEKTMASRLLVPKTTLFSQTKTLRNIRSEERRVG